MIHQSHVNDFFFSVPSTLHYCAQRKAVLVGVSEVLSKLYSCLTELHVSLLFGCVCLLACLFILSVLSVCFICLFYLSVCLFVCLSVCLFCLFVCLFVSLSGCVNLHPNKECAWKILVELV